MPTLPLPFNPDEETCVICFDKLSSKPFFTTAPSTDPNALACPRPGHRFHIKCIVNVWRHQNLPLILAQLFENSGNLEDLLNLHFFPPSWWVMNNGCVICRRYLNLHAQLPDFDLGRIEILNIIRAAIAREALFRKILVRQHNNQFLREILEALYPINTIGIRPKIRAQCTCPALTPLEPHSIRHCSRCAKIGCQNCLQIIFPSHNFIAELGKYRPLSANGSRALSLENIHAASVRTHFCQTCFTELGNLTNEFERPYFRFSRTSEGFIMHIGEIVITPEIFQELMPQ